MFGVQVQVNPHIQRPRVEFEQFDMAATDREGLFIVSGLPRRPLTITLTRHGYRYQMEALPADRDDVQWTYTLIPDAPPRPASRVEDEPIPLGLRERLTFVDLERHGNDWLADGPGGTGNDLDRLPRGIHKLGDGYFRIGEEMVHVQGPMRSDLPRSVKGIPVQARGDRLHFLHAHAGRRTTRAR